MSVFVKYLLMVGCVLSLAPIRCWGQASPAAAPNGSVAARDVSLRTLLPNIAQDQRRIWTFPARLGHERNWIPTAAILGATAALITADAREGAYFAGTRQFRGFNNVFSGTASAAGILLAPAALYAVGWRHQDSELKKTALFAGEALVNAEILTTVLKDATKRVRPSGFAPGSNYWDSWFESKGSILSGNGSFPSGHTIAAFSVATVIARRYGRHRWVPWAAYGLAAAVGFSRLSLSDHFLSDVFIGGALGYSIGRFTVLRQ